MKENKYNLCNNIVVLTYIFSPALKKVVYLPKTGNENIKKKFQTGPLLQSL